MERRMPVFADRFIELRGKRTQEEFAKFLGISRPTVGFYESGQRIPDALILRQIAEKCNVSADYLLGLTDEKTPDQSIQAICKKNAVIEQVIKNNTEATIIILAKESELNCDGTYFELLNKSIESYAPDPRYGFSFLSFLLESLFNYKNALAATHILTKLSDFLFEEELKKLGEDNQETTDEFVLKEAAQNTYQRFAVESRKLESDTHYSKFVRKMISAQNRIDEAFPSNIVGSDFPCIGINDIYRNRVIQCITDELSLYEMPYKTDE